jgi:hypothetical protein
MASILIDIAIKLEDVRAKSIIHKCYDSIKNGFKDLLIASKDGSLDSQFVQGIMFVLCEYMDDLKLND